MAPTTGQTTPF